MVSPKIKNMKTDRLRKQIPLKKTYPILTGVCPIMFDSESQSGWPESRARVWGKISLWADLHKTNT